MKRRGLWRGILIFWTLFIGLGAVGGGICMLIDPQGAYTGMGGLLPGLGKLPLAELLFTNLTFSGVALLIVNGATQLLTFAMLMRRAALAPTLGVACGVILMMWITIQFFIFPLNFLSTAYFIFGLLEALTGLALRRAEAAA